MLRFLIVSVGLILSASASAASYQDLAMLHGCWRGNSPAGTLTERWMSTQSDMIFGSDVLTDVNGRNLGWGTLIISNAASGVQFLYSDNGTAYQTFNLISSNGSGANFSAAFTSNAVNQEINNLILTLTNNQSLRVQLSGPNPAQSLDLLLNRVSASPDCQ
jgi:hypothetical protein